MATLGLVEYPDAPAEVRAVYDDIMATRHINWINNFWKALAHDPPTLRRTWESIKQIMAPGALDPLTKEMIYLAVSATNQCAYCIASHTAAARKAGMTDAMFAELMAVVGTANDENAAAHRDTVPADFTSPGGTLLSGLPLLPRGRGELHPESDRWRGSSSPALHRPDRAFPSSSSSPHHEDVDSLRGGECPGSPACGREDRTCGGPFRRRE